LAAIGAKTIIIIILIIIIIITTSVKSFILSLDYDNSSEMVTVTDNSKFAVCMGCGDSIL